MDQSKTVEDRIMKFSPSLQFLLVKFHPEILRGSPSEGIKQGRGGETSHFLALNVNISKTVVDMSKVPIND